MAEIETTDPGRAASQAQIRTEHASRYLQQLCKHWSHKFAVSFDPTHGVVPFPTSRCTFDATPDMLTLRIDAHADDLARMESVVVEHLGRFAFREALDIRWTPVTAP